MLLQTIRLKKSEERRLQSGHLWIFSNEINTTITPLKQFSPGEQVWVEAADGKLIGTAYLNPHSLICGRLISRDRKVLDRELLVHRISCADRLRQRIFQVPYYRLVYGESDLLPGLVVDRFGDHLAVQINSAGMEMLREEVIAALIEVISPRSILFRNDSSMRQLENLRSHIEPVFGTPPREVNLQENGVWMTAPLHDGQKTGWFYDQRPNRARLRDYVKGRSVLDVFSYVGSFGVQAAVFGAERVVSMDISAAALEMAERNAGQNNVNSRFSTLAGDAFANLREMRDCGEQFDVIIVDPPAFIKRKKDHKEGLSAYYRINELAMRLLPPEGILVSASCSMHLQREELQQILRSCGRRLNRHVQILEEGGPGADHPIHPAIPETRYLKSFISCVADEAGQ